jgi:carbamate kinase
MNPKLVFIAIGGNSLIKSKELRTVEDQHTAIQETVQHVADLVEQNYQVLISHGNGPQVGFIMRRSEVARRVTGLHLVPLVSVVADTQGSIGYQIQQTLNNELASRNIAGQCVTVVTQVVVDRDDPGFKEPVEAEQYIAEGHFAPGSMLPKIQSALRFLKNGGKEVIITAPEFIKAAVTGSRGTHIVP